MDDDLVLNISYDIHPKPKSIPKANKPRPSGSTSSPSKPGGNERKRPSSDSQPSRPTKRARTTTSSASLAAAAAHDDEASSQPAPAKAAPPKQRQIISSLFTSNPSLPSPSQSQARAQKEKPKPSNAPLRDTTTFEGLGLDPLLIRHMRTKMGIERPTAIQRAALQVLLRPSHPHPHPHPASASASQGERAPGEEERERDEEERDIFLQSQTGSGKTLSYLLPIIQDLLPLSAESWVDRSVGTLAVILAPTRELARQIYDVLSVLLSMRLSGPAGTGTGEEEGEEAGEDEDEHAEPSMGGGGGQRLTRWLVPGLLTGGSTRTHEKARLRKGLPILVSTPGRLLDHLQNTSSFSVGKLRWLVLDEADRLMDLGFERTIEGIVRALEGRRKLALAAAERGEGGGEVVGGWEWGWGKGRGRRTVLCSATLGEGVQKLAGVALVRPILIKGLAAAAPGDLPAPGRPAGDAAGKGEGEKGEEKFTPPAQLAQKYVVVPLKLRLVALIALLRSLLAKPAAQDGKEGKEGKEGVKRIIVFLSCTDAVDFIWSLLGGASMTPASSHPITEEEDSHSTPGKKSAKTKDSEEDNEGEEKAEGKNKKEKKEKKQGKEEKEEELARRSSLLPHTALYRLHGSLPLKTRLASLAGFTARPQQGKSQTQTAPADSPSSSILFCTSVASRGLDLPRVQAVVQYDLPTEGGATEYVHRVGRTARVGRGGEAWAFVAPSEADWVPWVEGKMNSSSSPPGEGGKESQRGKESRLVQVPVEQVLERGFGGRRGEWERRATQVQLAFERWALGSKENAALARKAYASHIRAYATHPSEEKHLFHVRNLHLGHLAKSFALREAPSNIKGANANAVSGGKAGKREREKGDVAEKMRRAIRRQARAGGGGEFQIADTVAL